MIKIIKNKINKEIEIQLKMLYSEYNDLNEFIEDLDVGEKKHLLYLLLDKLYFLNVAVGNNKKYKSEIENFIEEVEGLYEREVFGDERLKIVENNIINVGFRDFPTGVDDGVSKGIFESRVFFKEQVDVILKYISLGKENIDKEEILNDIRTLLIGGNVDTLEKVSSLDKMIVKELLK